MKFQSGICAATLTLSLATTANADFHNRKEIKALQETLSQCGFEPGPADGVWGTKTARATADYIRAHGGNPRSGVESVLLFQAAGYVISAGGPCPKNARQQDNPAPGEEIWDCRTVFETSGVALTANHKAETGTIKMGSLPTIETYFRVTGLDRKWIWHNSEGEQYQFVIGPRGGFGLLGSYFYFPASTEEDEMVEATASYTCEQTSG